MLVEAGELLPVAVPGWARPAGLPVARGAGAAPDRGPGPAQPVRLADLRARPAGAAVRLLLPDRDLRARAEAGARLLRLPVPARTTGSWPGSTSRRSELGGVRGGCPPRRQHARGGVRGGRPPRNQHAPGSAAGQLGLAGGGRRPGRGRRRAGRGAGHDGAAGSACRTCRCCRAATSGRCSRGGRGDGLRSARVPDRRTGLRWRARRRRSRPPRPRSPGATTR